jgi:hypothetical protein
MALGLYSHAQDVVFSFDNFENEFMNYTPVQRDGLSSKDFSYGKMIVEQTKKAVTNDRTCFCVSDYWNITTAFYVLNESKEHISIAFTKMAESDGSHEYILPYRDRVEFDDAIPKLYDYYYQKLKNSSYAEEHFDLDAYIQTNGLNAKLVKLISSIRDRDQEYRRENQSEFKAKQPVLDKRNQELIDSLFGVYKIYIGRSLVGKKFENEMWAVIQHSYPDMMERYLPHVCEAVQNKELHVTPLKMLVDRFYGLRYGYQIFGSQFGFGFDIADEKTRQEIMKKYQIN